MNIDTKTLVEAARQASFHAYAPYSQFRVGAAVLGDDRSVYAGCNVENASYGLTMCAERSALFTAIAGGAKKIVTVAIYAPTSDPVMPCGACRQVLAEFADATRVISMTDSGEIKRYTLEELLPHGFDL